MTDSSDSNAASDPAGRSTAGPHGELSCGESNDRFAEAPISRLVGFQVQPPETSACDAGTAAGHAVVLLECSRHHHNPMGRVHGGLIAALADSAMGIAFGRSLLPGEEFSTIDMQVSFIRPMKTGLLRAEAQVIERGLRIGFVRCEITNTRGKRVAVASCTCTLTGQSQ